MKEAIKKNISRINKHLPFIYPMARKSYRLLKNNIFVTAFLFYKFVREYKKFKKLSTNRFALRWSQRLPVLNQKQAAFGYDRHYLFHIAWASRKLASIRPQRHIDISSQIYFIASVSAFIPVKYYEFKAIDAKLDNLSFGSADLVNLPFKDKSIASLSCMHVVEHVGLGRYGDPLDYDGDLKAIFQLQRVLAVGGNLLFVVPISGLPRIEYNAHRIFSYQQITNAFGELRLKEFALIPDKHDDGDILFNATKEMADAQCHGCGCFWFVRDK